jgi:hypothetical protein
MLSSACKSSKPQVFPISAAAALIALMLSWPAQALVINATYTGLSASVQNEINSAIGFYQTMFSDPITVDLEFHDMSSGLGHSYTHFYFWTYASYRAALIGDATSANDAIANGTLGAGPNDPILNSRFITLKSANGRAVGLNTPGLLVDIPGVCNFTGDGCTNAPRAFAILRDYSPVTTMNSPAHSCLSM